MKNLCVSLFIALVASFVCNHSAQAAQASDISTDSIVTIQYTTSHHTYYLAATSTSRVGVVNDNPTENCLWKYSVDESGNITLKSVGQSTTSTSYYLYASYSSKKYSLSLSTSRSSFTLYDASGTTSKKDEYINNTSLKITLNKNTCYLKCEESSSGWPTKTYSGSYSISTSQSNVLRIQEWGQKGETSLEMSMSPNNASFGLWATDFIQENANVSKTVTLSMKYTQRSYYYNKSKTSSQINKGSTTKTKPSDLQKSGIIPTIAWQNATGTTTGTTATMTYGTLTANTNDWTFDITPSGYSPTADISVGVGNFPDYTDNVVATATCAGQSYTAQTTAIREAFLIENFNGLETAFEPAQVVFEPDQNLTKTMEIKMGFKVSKTYYAAINGRLAKEIISKQEVIDLTNPAECAKVTYTITPLQDAVGEAPDWLTASPSGSVILGLPSNRITLTADVNPALIGRAARIHADFKYEDGGTTYTSSLCQGAVTQLSNATAAAIQFQSYHGVGDANLDAQGRQRVHENKKTIYYTSGQSIQLTIPENQFQGWMRWYDYNTGRNPIYNSPDAGFQWTTEPTGCSDINTGKFSMGLYKTRNVSKNYNNNPVIKAWNDGEMHQIACDLSNYKDYSVNVTNGSGTIKEPTLSYRVLYTFLPAKDMADSLAKCTGNKFYETHQYVVPGGKDVLLETNYRYKTAFSHTSELCYWYWDGSTLKNVGGSGVSATWYKNGSSTNTGITYSTATADLAQINIPAGTEATYDLKFTVDGTTYNIARFIVTAQNQATECGPSKTALITPEEIANEYVSMSYIDFNFTADDPDRTTGGWQHFAPVHMPWTDGSYGYTYHTGYPVVGPATDVPTTSQAVNSGFVSYGEYTLVDSVHTSWGADGGAYGGHGYCLYADGMIAPGIAASISADTKICSGQLMYCSAWLRNPRNSGGDSNPIFRFNVQGSNDNVNWEDIGVFMAGEFANKSGWQQVVFPLVSAHDYAHVRVSLYNFGKGSNGNDFMVDEIRLFAGKLPLSSYQASTSCLSSTAITSVIRLDFNNLSEDWGNQHMFYDIFNYTKDSTIVPVDGYYGTNPNYGEFIVPVQGYNPTITENSLVYSNITEFVDSIQYEYAANNFHRNKRGYVQELVMGKPRWVMYLVHLLDNMDARNTYQIRMVSDIRDINTPQCVLTTVLPIAKETGAQINGQTAPELSGKLCANNLVSIDMEVSNENAEGTTQKGYCLADWLYAYPSDSIYLPDRSPSQTEIEEADALFLSRYGYSRIQVKDAIRSLRRVYYDESGESDDELNPNRFVYNTNLLDSNGFDNKLNYHIIMHLADTLKLLQLGVQKQDFYMMANQNLYYWIYPIKGTGHTDEGEELEVCDNPMMIGFSTEDSKYMLNLSTKDINDLTPEQLLQVPGVRVSAAEVNKAFRTPVSNIDNCVIGFDSTQLVSSNDPYLNQKLAKGQTVSIRYWQDRIYQDASAAAYYQNGQYILFKPVDAARVADLQQRYIEDNEARPGTWTEGHPGWQHANTDTLRSGYEYVFKTTMMTTTFQAKAADEFCPVGETFFRLIVVPDTMLWSPKGNEYNDWSDDDNWRGIVDGDTLDYGYVPMAHTTVIIPPLEDEKLYPYISNNELSIDAFYNPIVCKNIVFSGNSKMLNQTRLKYEKAYAELVVPAAQWEAVAMPLNAVYSGDMYIPKVENDNPCIVNKLDYVRGTADGYHFWGSYYNETVPVYQYDGMPTDRNGQPNKWNRSNKLNEHIAPGQGFGLLGFGPNYSETGDLTIRLPKTDTKYNFANDAGDVVESLSFTINRTGANRLALQFDHLAANGDSAQSFTITNKVSDTRFLFGNPTMAYIDMYKFLADNDLQLTYQYAQSSGWKGATYPSANAVEDRYLAPMHAAIIQAKAASTSLTVEVCKSHLTINTDLNAPTTGTTPAYAPRRAKNVRLGYLRSDVMNIYATNEYGTADIRLCINNFADDDFVQDEDAPFVYSMNVDDAAFMTPVNIYTVAGDVALSADVRSEIKRVPLAFYVDPDYATPTMTLYFNLSKDWPQNVWLYDSQTNKYAPIYNGIAYDVETPENHAIRYYLVGSISEDPQIPTSLNEDNIQRDPVDGNVTSDWKLSVYTMHAGHATIFSDWVMTDITAYDIAGREVAHIVPRSTAATMTLPSGVMMLRVRSSAGEQMLKALVK